MTRLLSLLPVLVAKVALRSNHLELPVVPARYLDTAVSRRCQETLQVSLDAYP